MDGAHMTRILTLLILFSPAIVSGENDYETGKSKAIICIGCHGTDGNSTNAVYPKLAGQHTDYLVKQITDFKSGARLDDHMNSMVEGIKKTDIKPIATYFSMQKRTAAEASHDDVGLGEKIYLHGLKDRGVPACSNCHGSKRSGKLKTQPPRLAAQHQEYLSKALKDFHDGKRRNDEDATMRNIAVKLQDNEISAVSSYAASIKPAD